MHVAKEFIAHISALTTCATLCNGHGRTFVAEAGRYAKEVCEVARSLALVFSETLSATSPPYSKADEEGKEYLVRTGAVHETIERIRRDLPEDNLDAVRKRWGADKDMLQDSLEDVNGMVEEVEEAAEDRDEEDEGFGSDEEDLDGLGALGFSSKKLTKEELERVKKVCAPCMLRSLQFKI